MGKTDFFAVFKNAIKNLWSLPVRSKAEIKANLKRNWYFPISAMALFCLNATLTLGFVLGLIIAFAIAVLTASQITSIWSYIKDHSNARRLLSITTAIGICWGNQTFFYTKWNGSSQTSAWMALLPIDIDIPKVVSILGAVAALLFVYFYVLIFWDRFIETIKSSGAFDGVKAAEWAVYGILLAVFMIFMAVSFAHTQAFYGTDFAYNIIYEGDSPSLVKGNAYLALAHHENDLRQPLFAVFAAPFIGIPYLISRLIGASASVQAILMNSAQIIMLFAANFVLARIMKLDPLKRICFMSLISCTYTQLLFTLMMEQYIVAYFWLMLCLYHIVEKRLPDRIVFLGGGTGGTLLTSMVLLPFMSTKSPIKDLKAWFLDIVKFGLEFVALMLTFCRFDVIFDLIPKISYLRSACGESVPFSDKIYRYTVFIKNLFVAPDAGVNTADCGHISWQLAPAVGINIAGVLIFVLAVVSVIWNRDKKSSLLAGGWVVFSVVMLLVIGYGTIVNGMILYSLYFGWGFFVLLFQLVEKMESKLKFKFLMPVFTVCTVIMLLIMNVPAMKEMIEFAVAYYPV